MRTLTSDEDTPLIDADSMDSITEVGAHPSHSTVSEVEDTMEPRQQNAMVSCVKGWRQIY